MKCMAYKIHDTYHHDFGNNVALVEFLLIIMLGTSLFSKLGKQWLRTKNGNPHQ